MEIAANFFDRFQFQTAHAPRNEHQEMVDKFLSRLNSDRAKAGFPALNFSRVAKMLKGLTPSEMHRLYQECEGAEKFGGLLKWKLAQMKV